MESEMPTNGSGFSSDPNASDADRMRPVSGKIESPQRLRPAPWTPEDATKLIVASIREMQSPMLHSLKRTGVPKTTFLVTVFLLALVIAGAGYLLYEQHQFYKEQSAQQQALFQNQLTEREAQLTRLQKKSDAVESAKTALQDQIATKAFQALDTVSQNEQAVEDLALTQTELQAERKRATDLRSKYAAILADMNQQAASLADREAAAARMERELLRTRKEAESVTDASKEQQDRIANLAGQLTEAQLLIREQKRTIEQLRENFRKVADVFDEMESTPRTPAADETGESWVPGATPPAEAPTPDAPAPSKASDPAPTKPTETTPPDATGEAQLPPAEEKNGSGWITRTTSGDNEATKPTTKTSTDTEAATKADETP